MVGKHGFGFEVYWTLRRIQGADRQLYYLDFMVEMRQRLSDLGNPRGS